MKTNIFVPKKINVGFNNRNDTYTGKLAYIIYFDEKGTLRKETSWQSWRNQSIPNEIYDNEPMEGFVINKKVGGVEESYYDVRKTYVRIYDPRGFEFEITIPNLLWILENCDCIKGKGLEGEFVYGWDGKELVLVPVESPDYKEIVEKNKIIHNNEFVKAKDLVVGATYETLNGDRYVYMGKFDKWEKELNYYNNCYGRADTIRASGYNYPVDKTWHIDKSCGILSLRQDYISEWQPTLYRYVNKGKQFWFIHLNSLKNAYTRKRAAVSFKSISRKFSKIVSTECHSDYIEFIDMLNKNDCYSPIDYEATKYCSLSYEAFEKQILSNSDMPYYSNHRRFGIIRDDNIYYVDIKTNKDNNEFSYEVERYDKSWRQMRARRDKFVFNDIAELYKNINPVYVVTYLENGNEYERKYYYGAEE